MNKIIMSTEIPELTLNLSKFRYEIIESEVVEDLLPFEQRHADLQCLKIKDTYFVLKNCKKLKEKLLNLNLNVIETKEFARKKYPNNILLNCVYINDILLCNEKSIDENLKNHCINEGIRIINVNQGYTKCSTAVIDNKFITSDKGIYEALTSNRVGGLLINSGDIQLFGVDYGFIGGCCFSDKHNVYFTGNVTLHKDYDKICDFCYSLNKNIICLNNKELYDIGGFIVI